MIRDQDVATAVAERCETICHAVGLPRATGVEFVRAVFDAFPAEGSAPGAERGWRQRAYLLAQAFHCRLPAPGLEDVLRNAGTVAAAVAFVPIAVCYRGRPHLQDEPGATQAV